METKEKSKSPFARNLISKNEGKLTYVQIFGFVLIAMGVVYLASFMLPSGVVDYIPSWKLEQEPTANGVAIAFFSTMLGVSFAFPSMLKGQTKEMSTMRIVVFMMVNVICMLLLKIGWEAPSLKAIGLDGYWVSIIGFLFGAKAVQSYLDKEKEDPETPDSGKTNLSEEDIAKLAAAQNSELLRSKYPNIQSVSDTLDGSEHVVAIYVKDDDIQSIPAELTATLPDGSKKQVKTEIIADSGMAIPHIGQTSDELSDSRTPNYYGSVCCIVESLTNPNFRGLVTSGHVLTYGAYFNYGGVLGDQQQRPVCINGKPSGKLFFQQMKYNQDLAIIEVANTPDLQNNYISFKGFHKISNTDVKTEKPNLKLGARQNNQSVAYVLDYNITFEIVYSNMNREVRNIILIGSTNDRATSKTVSKGGDSGGCVYTNSGELVGMILGGNAKFTFVLPLEETLTGFNFKTI